MADNNKVKLKVNYMIECIKKYWFNILIVILFALAIALFLYGSHNDKPYSVVLFIYVILFLIIIICMYGLICLRIKHHFARKIEIFGYAILLTLLMRSFFISDDTQLMTKLINLEKKTDYVFSYISTSNESFQRSLIKEYSDTYDTSVRREYWLKQEEFSDTLTLVLKILSTVCIAIGRFDDISSKKKDDKETSAILENHGDVT